MAQNRKRRSLWTLAPVYLVVAILAILAQSTEPAARPIDRGIRSAALLGYQLVFLSIISSAYLQRLVKMFGRPFVHMHHVLSVAGLVFISVHPLMVAVDWADASVLFPQAGPLLDFLELAGRPAWYLIATAAIVALLRRRLGNRWRIVHMLNYLAFLLATVHANLYGSNFQHPVTRVISIVMAVVVVAIFVQRRLQASHRSAKSKA